MFRDVLSNIRSARLYRKRNRESPVGVVKGAESLNRQQIILWEPLYQKAEPSSRVIFIESGAQILRADATAAGMHVRVHDRGVSGLGAATEVDIPAGSSRTFGRHLLHWPPMLGITVKAYRPTSRPAGVSS